MLQHERVVVERSGGCPQTTNNRMELTAAIEGLKATPPSARVLLRSDSQLVVKTINLGWKRNANKDLWDALDRERLVRDVSFEWVKGHDQDPYNTRADELATRAAKLASRPGVSRGVQPEPPRSSATKLETVAGLPRRGLEPRNPPRLTSVASESEAVKAIGPLLREGEEIARCAQCGREFVRQRLERPEDVCSLVTCQLAARR